MRKWVGRALAAVAGLVIVGTTGIAYAYPPLAAAICPECFAMQRVSPRLFVERQMPEPTRLSLVNDAAAAAQTVKSYFGEFRRNPTIVACATRECDRLIGGRGARAVTLSTPAFSVIHVSPNGLNQTILTHEFAHVELHRRIGIAALLTARLPAWFDEGVATLVSQDARYVKFGESAHVECIRDAPGPLPSNPLEWSRTAGKDAMIYADAACRVARWIMEHGGKQSLIEMLNHVSCGGTLEEWKRVQSM